MATKHHDETLKRYLKQKTGQSGSGSASIAQARGGGSARGDVKSAARTSASSAQVKALPGRRGGGDGRAGAGSGRARVVPAARPRGRASFNSAPDEVLLEVFWRLDVAGLMRAAQVCRRWAAVTQDNCLWEEVYRGLKVKEKEDHPAHPAPGYWRDLCICRSWESKVKKVKSFTSRRVDRFTGLPANTVKAVDSLGARFQLEIELSTGEIFSCLNMDVKHFASSLCIRFDHGSWPAKSRIKSLKLLCVCPLFPSAQAKGRFCGPCRRSLLFEERMNLAEVCRKSCDGHDDSLEIRILPGGWVLATWKADGEIAWIAVSLHHFLLTERLTHGHEDTPYEQVPRPVTGDDIDSQHGLYGYQVCVELRNFRNSLWSEQFRDLHTRPEHFAGGHAVLQCVTPDDRRRHSTVSQRPRLLWRTSCFKGVVQGVCLLDCTAIDGNGRVVWTCRDAVVIKPTTETLCYDYQGEGTTVFHQNDKGWLKMGIIWMTEEEQGFIVSLELGMALAHVNNLFGTKY